MRGVKPHLCAVRAIVLSCAAHAAGQSEMPAPPFVSEPQVQMWLEPRLPSRPMPASLFENSFAQSTNSFPDGDGPSAVAITPDGMLALVANHTTDSIGVVDLSIPATTLNIPTPEYPEHLVITPDGRYALTADAYNNTVSIYDIPTRTLITSIPSGGNYPYRICVSDDSTRAVVGCINDASISSFTVIDIPSRSAVRTFSSASQGVVGSFYTFETGQTGYIYSQFALTPDGSKVVSLDRVNGRVMVYSADTGAQLAALPCPQFPTAVRISADGTRAAVTHESSINQISSLNISALTIASFPAGTLLNQSVAVTNDGSQAITIQLPSNVVFTNLTTGATTGTVTLPTLPQDLAMFARGSRLFASGSDAAIIDVTSRTLIQTMPLGVGYQAAASANGLTGVALNNRYREELLVYRLTPGSAGGIGIVPTGQSPESDGPRTIALSPDGHTVIAANNISGNACIWNLTMPESLTLVNVGVRPLDVAFRPDGRQAAVVAADSDRLTLINLSASGELDTASPPITVPARPVRAVYSADGSLVFVLCIDAKQLVAVNTTTGQIVNTVGAGTPRISYAVSYLQFPGMTLSPDGAVLALCDGGSSPARLRLYNASTLALLGTAPTGAYPMNVAFSPDSSLAFVPSYTTDTLAIIRVTGGPITKLASAFTLPGPVTVTVDQSGEYVYVGCNDASGPGLSVIDVASFTNVLDVDTTPYRARAAAFNPACSQLFIAAEGDSDDRLYRFHAQGPTTTVLDQTPLSWSASCLVLSRQRNTALAAQPVFDTLDLVTFDVPADIDADGLIDLADFFAFLDAFDNSGPKADITDDGMIDLDDFFYFLNAFDLGCN